MTRIVSSFPFSMYENWIDTYNTFLRPEKNRDTVYIYQGYSSTNR